MRRETLRFLTVTHCSLQAKTHTDTRTAPFVHSQSQIRWQIRRLMLRGRCGVGGPPLFSRPCPKTHTPTSCTLHNRAGHAQTHTHVSHLRLKIPPPIQVPAFSFILPLGFNPPSVSFSQRLSSFPQQPHSQSGER